MEESGDYAIMQDGLPPRERVVEQNCMVLTFCIMACDYEMGMGMKMLSMLSTLMNKVTDAMDCEWADSWIHDLDSVQSIHNRTKPVFVDSMSMLSMLVLTFCIKSTRA